MAQQRKVYLSRFFDKNCLMISGMCAKCYEEQHDVRIVGMSRKLLRKSEENMETSFEKGRINEVKEYSEDVKDIRIKRFKNEETWCTERNEENGVEEYHDGSANADISNNLSECEENFVNNADLHSSEENVNISKDDINVNVKTVSNKEIFNATAEASNELSFNCEDITLQNEETDYIKEGILKSQSGSIKEVDFDNFASLPLLKNEATDCDMIEIVLKQEVKSGESTSDNLLVEKNETGYNDTMMANGLKVDESIEECNLKSTVLKNKDVIDFKGFEIENEITVLEEIKCERIKEERELRSKFFRIKNEEGVNKLCTQSGYFHIDKQWLLNNVFNEEEREMIAGILKKGNVKKEDGWIDDILKKETDDYPPGSQTPLWSPPRSPHNLIEESLYRNPWSLLVATIFLNKTSCYQARPCIEEFLEHYPDPQTVLRSKPAELEKYFHKIGLKKRSEQVWRMSHDFLHKKWQRAGELHGIGKYGDDAFEMFCRGNMDVQPNDRFLKIYKAWNALRVKNEETGGLDSKQC